jgi:single-stranded-DNA-specific exonuclease
MSIGIRCLIEDDPLAARAGAERLDALNRERREIEAKMQAVALDAIRHLDLGANASRAALCLFDPSWHQGVVGLVASRVKDRVHRPVIAFARSAPGELRGSARSIPGLHVRDVLDALATREPGLVDRFGGHAMAAGLTLRESELDRFARAFEREVARGLGGVALEAGFDTDGELEEADFCLATARVLRDGGPWGQCFPEPCFDGEFLVESARVVGDRHLKLGVRPVSARGRFDAMAFNFFDPDAAAAPPPAGRVRIVYRLFVNEYQGIERLQLLVDHLETLA